MPKYNDEAKRNEKYNKYVENVTPKANCSVNCMKSIYSRRDYMCNRTAVYNGVNENGNFKG